LEIQNYQGFTFQALIVPGTFHHQLTINFLFN